MRFLCWRNRKTSPARLCSSSRIHQDNITNWRVIKLQRTTRRWPSSYLLPVSHHPLLVDGAAAWTTRRQEKMCLFFSFIDSAWADDVMRRSYIFRFSQSVAIILSFRIDFYSVKYSTCPARQRKTKSLHLPPSTNSICPATNTCIPPRIAKTNSFFWPSFYHLFSIVPLDNPCNGGQHLPLFFFFFLWWKNCFFFSFSFWRGLRGNEGIKSFESDRFRHQPRLIGICLDRWTEKSCCVSFPFFCFSLSLSVMMMMESTDQPRPLYTLRLSLSLSIYIYMVHIRVLVGWENSSISRSSDPAYIFPPGN